MNSFGYSNGFGPFITVFYNSKLVDRVTIEHIKYKYTVMMRGTTVTLHHDGKTLITLIKRLPLLYAAVHGAYSNGDLSKVNDRIVSSITDEVYQECKGIFKYESVDEIVKLKVHVDHDDNTVNSIVLGEKSDYQIVLLRDSIDIVSPSGKSLIKFTQTPAMLSVYESIHTMHSRKDLSRDLKKYLDQKTINDAFLKYQHILANMEVAKYVDTMTGVDISNAFWGSCAISGIDYIVTLDSISLPGMWVSIKPSPFYECMRLIGC